jgi:adenine/guanine phosphoribosyltransferase-like PRPP-binding protein
MADLSFREISERIKDVELPDFDFVAGIAEGGLVPASLLAYKLGIELITVRINFRDSENNPRYDMPKVLAAPQKILTGKNILIVDDVSVTGKTLAAAAELFRGNNIKTFALKGKADFVVFPEIRECVDWPWKIR